jgi:hypothetical protein
LFYLSQKDMILKNHSNRREWEAAGRDIYIEI